MKIKDIIFENDDADDIFAPSERSLRSLNQATFQQRIPAMIRSAYAALDAQTGWFPIHLARDIGQCASQLYKDTEVYTLADQMIRQDIMPIIGNILHGLDSEAMQHQDNLGDAIADDVESIQRNSGLGAHIADLHEQEHISPDEYYECYHAIEGHIADLLIRVIYNAYVSTKITDVEEGRKKKKKKASRSLGRYFFPGFGYYGSGESGEGNDGGGGESVNTGLNEDAVMGKIEQSGQIVRILKKQHTVPFSSDKDWLLIDTDPAKGNKGLGIKWVPATTRFEWVRSYKDTLNQEVAESNVFTDARMNAIKAGQDTFVVHGKTYQVTGDTTDELEAGITENFIDGRNPQDKGDSKRHGINTRAGVSSLRKTAKQGGRKGQLAHWLANMKAGRAKANKK
jgi:hypothetical protein